MTQMLLFARHGNSFAPADKVVWVGRETDLPLVAKGREQAMSLAAALRERDWLPDVIYCAGLQRTRSSAEIIADHLGLPAPIVDSRLLELDYGAWAGRSNDEISAADPAAAAAMAAWNSSDLWPDLAGWRSERAEVMAALRDFVDDRLAFARHRRPLVLSSNGILRFLPRLLLAESIPGSFKMATGHAGIMTRRQSESARLHGWDVPPAELARVSVD